MAEKSDERLKTDHQEQSNNTGGGETSFNSKERNRQPITRKKYPQAKAYGYFGWTCPFHFIPRAIKVIEESRRLPFAALFPGRLFFYKDLIGNQGSPNSPLFTNPELGRPPALETCPDLNFNCRMAARLVQSPFRKE